MGRNNDLFKHPFDYEWELTKSPAGAHPRKPKGNAGAGTVPDAFDDNKKIAPSMLTTDLALRFDPEYEKISRRFKEHPDEFALAFAKAWHKPLHRDMGPIARYLGPWVAPEQLWQDPVPKVDHPLVDDEDVAVLKQNVLASGLSVAQLVWVAWRSASSFRATDKRGGANGARIRLAPQKDWEVNEPAGLHKVLGALDLARQGRRIQRTLLSRLRRPKLWSRDSCRRKMTACFPWSEGRLTRACGSNAKRSTTRSGRSSRSSTKRPTQ